MVDDEKPISIAIAHFVAGKQTTDPGFSQIWGFGTVIIIHAVHIKRSQCKHTIPFSSLL
jgi:hypothetical protein